MFLGGVGSVCASHEKGLIYRGEVIWSTGVPIARRSFPISKWSTKKKMPISEYIKNIPWPTAKAYVVIATHPLLRPCWATRQRRCNPGDERAFGKLVVKEIPLLVAGRRIPIIADESVDPEFGHRCREGYLRPTTPGILRWVGASTICPLVTNHDTRGRMSAAAGKCGWISIMLPQPCCRSWKRRACWPGRWIQRPCPWPLRPLQYMVEPPVSKQWFV